MGINDQMVSNDCIYSLSTEVGELLKRQGLRLALAESCTGGWITKCITDVPGSSDWFDRAFITYSNDAKCEMLDIPASLIDHYGAVSEAVVRAMVEGAIRTSSADVAISVSGIAGPGGGSKEKPVGSVWFGWHKTGEDTVARLMKFDGDRDAVRRSAVEHALSGLINLLAE